VHALGQVAAVTLNNPIPLENFRRAVNRLLPQSIRIKDVDEVQLEFHPRFAAVRKTYRYSIFREEVCPPFERRYVYHHPYPLGEPAMIEAAGLFVGTHDFSAFAARDERDTLGGSKVRTISESTLRRNGPRLEYLVTGSGFLKHMVRNMVGVLLEVGKANIGPADLRERLQPQCGIRPGPTAPASGLFLTSVEY
jgi:tRNA pseudouridine38-40 synthase